MKELYFRPTTVDSSSKIADNTCLQLKVKLIVGHKKSRKV